MRLRNPEIVFLLITSFVFSILTITSLILTPSFTPILIGTIIFYYFAAWMETKT